MQFKNLTAGMVSAALLLSVADAQSAATLQLPKSKKVRAGLFVGGLAATLGGGYYLWGKRSARKPVKLSDEESKRDAAQASAEEAETRAHAERVAQSLVVLGFAYKADNGKYVPRFPTHRDLGQQLEAINLQLQRIEKQAQTVVKPQDLQAVRDAQEKALNAVKQTADAALPRAEGLTQGQAEERYGVRGTCDGHSLKIIELEKSMRLAAKTENVTGDLAKANQRITELSSRLEALSKTLASLQSAPTLAAGAAHGAAALAAANATPQPVDDKKNDKND